MELLRLIDDADCDLDHVLCPTALCHIVDLEEVDGNTVKVEEMVSG